MVWGSKKLTNKPVRQIQELEEENGSNKEGEARRNWWKFAWRKRLKRGRRANLEVSGVENPLLPPCSFGDDSVGKEFKKRAEWQTAEAAQKRWSYFQQSQEEGWVKGRSTETEEIERGRKEGETGMGVNLRQKTEDKTWLMQKKP